MSSDRQRWEERYGGKEGFAERPPSDFLRRHWSELPRGRVLEVAAGDGRNTLFLARHGFAVDAIDISFAALQRLMTKAHAEKLPMRVVQADLENFPLPAGGYDGLVNIRYLQRSSFPELRRALKPGGVILFETFLTEQRTLGHPINPAYLLAPGELAAAFAGFEILVCEEGRFETELGPAFLARLLARRRR